MTNNLNEFFEKAKSAHQQQLNEDAVMMPKPRDSRARRAQKAALRKDMKNAQRDIFYDALKNKGVSPRESKATDVFSDTSLSNFQLYNLVHGRKRGDIQHQIAPGAMAPMTPAQQMQQMNVEPGSTTLKRSADGNLYGQTTVNPAQPQAGAAAPQARKDVGNQFQWLRDIQKGTRRVPPEILQRAQQLQQEYETSLKSLPQDDPRKIALKARIQELIDQEHQMDMAQSGGGGGGAAMGAAPGMMTAPQPPAQPRPVGFDSKEDAMNAIQQQQKPSDPFAEPPAVEVEPQMPQVKLADPTDLPNIDDEDHNEVGEIMQDLVGQVVKMKRQGAGELGMKADLEQETMNNMGLFATYVDNLINNKNELDDDEQEYIEKTFKNLVQLNNDQLQNFGSTPDERRVIKHLVSKAFVDIASHFNNLNNKRILDKHGFGVGRDGIEAKVDPLELTKMSGATDLLTYNDILGRGQVDKENPLDVGDLDQKRAEVVDDAMERLTGRPKAEPKAKTQSKPKATQKKSQEERKEKAKLRISKPVEKALQQDREWKQADKSRGERKVREKRSKSGAMKNLTNIARKTRDEKVQMSQNRKPEPGLSKAERQSMRQDSVADSKEAARLKRSLAELIKKMREYQRKNEPESILWAVESQIEAIMTRLEELGESRRSISKRLLDDDKLKFTHSGPKE